MPPDPFTDGLTALLQRAAQLAVDQTSTPVWQPEPGSLGEKELRNVEVGRDGPWGERPVRTAWLAAAMAIRAAAEYARSLARLVSPDASSLTAEVIARAAIEAGAGAAWLLEPSIGPRARVCRLQLSRVHGAIWLEEALAEVGAKEPQSDYGDTQEQVRSMSATLGLRDFTGGKWADTCETETRPKYRKRVARLLKEQPFAGAYVIYSGTAHAELWALRRHFKGAETRPGSADPRLDLAPDRRGMHLAIHGVLLSLLVPLQLAGELFGWHQGGGPGADQTAFIAHLNAEMQRLRPIG